MLIYILYPINLYPHRLLDTSFSNRFEIVVKINQKNGKKVKIRNPFVIKKPDGIWESDFCKKYCILFCGLALEKLWRTNGFGWQKDVEEEAWKKRN